MIVKMNISMILAIMKIIQMILIVKIIQHFNPLQNNDIILMYID